MKTPKQVSEYMSKIGSRGGKKRVKNNSHEKIKEWGGMRRGEKSQNSANIALSEAKLDIVQ